MVNIQTTYRIHWLKILVVVLIVSPSCLLFTCKKFDPKADLVIASDHIEVFDPGEYRLHGYLINIGDDDVINHGFLWDVGKIPGLGSFVIDLGNTETEEHFSGDIFVLGENTTYYMRAFATTPTETKYGSTLEFTTGAAPKVPFDNITREHIRTVLLSDTPINGSDNAENQITAGTIVLYKTNENRFGKLQILSYGYSIQFRYRTFSENGSIYSGSNLLEISGTWSADLDEGVETTNADPVYTPDFFWEQVSAVVRYMTPVNEALFYRYYIQ